MIKFFSFFHENIRNSLPFDNYKKLFLFRKLEFFGQEIAFDFLLFCACFWKIRQAD